MINVTSASVEVHVFCRNGAQPLYLIVHQAPGDRYEGQWRIVTGNMQQDESAFISAVRNLYEKTGLRAKDLFSLDYVHEYYDPQTESINMAPVFAVEVTEPGVALSKEYDDSRWITFDQAVGMLRWPGHRDGLQRVHEDIVTSPSRGSAFRITTHG